MSTDLSAATLQAAMANSRALLAGCADRGDSPQLPYIYAAGSFLDYARTV